MADIRYPAHFGATGDEIRARALALTRAAQNKDKDDGGVICAAIDKLYAFLDLLDRKAGSLVTLNSFLLALAGIFVFKPLGIFEPGASQTVALDTLHLCNAQTWILIAGGIAVLASFIAIAAAVGIFRIRWGFMEHVDPARGNYGDELGMLCNEAAFRQARLGLIRSLTLTALGLTAVAVVIQLIQIFR